jgi:hypothetical protein
MSVSPCLQARAKAGSASAVNALAQCVDDPRTFCRVRADAARALGRGLHSFTFQLNVSAVCGTTGVFRVFRG